MIFLHVRTINFLGKGKAKRVGDLGDSFLPKKYNVEATRETAISTPICLGLFKNIFVCPCVLACRAFQFGVIAVPRSFTNEKSVEKNIDLHNLRMHCRRQVGGLKPELAEKTLKTENGIEMQ